MIEQFDTRFNNFDMLRKDLILFKNPLTAQIKDQSLDLQTELYDLQCDLFLKTRLEKGVDFFFNFKYITLSISQEFRFSNFLHVWLHICANALFPK